MKIMATAPVYRLTIIRIVYSQFKLKTIQGGWDKFSQPLECKAHSKQGQKEEEVISAARYFELHYSQGSPLTNF